MKTLIAGFGSIGRRHLNNLRALGESDILLYRTHQSTLPEDDIRGIPVEADLNAALAHKPDMVVIANPTALHLDVAIPCAQAGCSILMEKPVSHSMDRIGKLQRALSQGGGQFLTGFQYRFHPGLVQVKKWLSEEKIGQITSVQSHWGEYLPNWHPWEDYRNSYSARADLGGGVVNTLSHPLDYIRWMLGDFNSLYAKTSNRGLNLPVEDTADILVNFDSGVCGNIHLDYIQRPPQHSLEIIGTTGSIFWDNVTGICKRYDTKNEVWEEFHLPAGFERNTLFLTEMAHFIQVVSKKETPLCSLEDGIAALQTALAIHRSAREGCLVKF